MKLTKAGAQGLAARRDARNNMIYKEGEVTDRDLCISLCRARGCTTAGILGCMRHFTASLWIERAGKRIDQCHRPNYHADQVTDEYLEEHAHDVEDCGCHEAKARESIGDVRMYGAQVISRALKERFPNMQY